MNKYSYSITILLFSLFSLPTFSLADSNAGTGVYKWVDSNKKVHYTDRPAPGKIVEQDIEAKIRKAAGLTAKTPANEKNNQYDTDKVAATQTDTNNNNNEETTKKDNDNKIDKKPADQKASPLNKEEQAKKQKESAEAYAKKLATYCEQKKQNLNILLKDSPVAWEEQGQTILLSAEQRKEKVQSIKTILKEKCTK